MYHYRLIFFASILLFGLFITSCEYEPVKKYTLDLTRPAEAPPIDIDLNLLTDTVTIYWGSEVNFRIDAGKLKVTSVKFYLDGQEVNVNSTNSKYSVALDFSQPGIHKFKMIIYTNSGTTSIADMIGAEGFQYNSREWTLVVKDYHTFSNLSYKLDNKDLCFTWKEYDSFDFKSYRLKELATGSSYDIGETSFRLTTYVGEGSDFDLYVIDKEDKEFLWGRCSVDKSLPVLRIGNINNQVALIWNKTIFSENISEYQLFQDIQGSGWTNIGTFSNVDTAFLIKGIEKVFGEHVSYYLYCVPKSYTYIDNNSLFSSFLLDAPAALPGPMLDTHYYGESCAGFYFDRFSSVYQQNILFRYSTITDKADSLMDYNFWWDFSPNAKNLLLSRDSILNLYDLNTNTITHSKNFKSITKDFYPWVGTIISDNGICIFTLNNILYAYDFLNDKLIASENMIINALKISPGGQYFSGTRNDSLLVYKINENSVSLASGIKQPYGTYSFTNYDFCSDQPDNMYFYESPVLYVKSCLDLSVIRSFTIGNSFFNIDFCSHKILTARDGYWDVYDFNTGELLQSIHSELGTGSSNYVLITNNTIFCSGYKYFLPD